MLAVLGQAVGEHAAGGAGADDDVVERLASPRRAQYGASMSPFAT